MAREAWLLLAVIGLGCNPATQGLGDSGQSEGSESGDGDGDSGDGDGDGDSGDGDGDSGDGDGDSGDGDGDGDSGDGDGDGDGEPTNCADPLVDVSIELLGPSYPAGDCNEPVVTGWVEAADAGVYTISECSCDQMDCGGDMVTLTIVEPDALWLPALEVGQCYSFAFFSEAIMPDGCRKSRVDIFTGKEPPPWYSTGSSAVPEVLDTNGLSVAGVNPGNCTDGCGDWTLSDVEFGVNGESVVVPTGMTGMLTSPADNYDVSAWVSYEVAPSDCDLVPTKIARTAWAAQRTGP
jgi:hypothetical protein